MNRHDAAARLEALLARVIARKEAPRGHAHTPTAPSPVEAPAKPTTPEVMAAVDALDDDANDGSPEVSLHPPLAGDSGVGPEIDLIERTMDLDVAALEATLASTQETFVTIARPFQAAPSIDVSATLDEAAAFDEAPALDEPRSVEPEALRAPTPLPLRAPTPLPLRAPTPLPLRALTPARPLVQAEVVEPEALAPHRPVMRASTPPPLRAPTPAPVVEVAPPAPEAREPERFEPKALPVEAAAVQVVAMPPLAPRSLRDLLARSMTLKVRPTPRG